MVFVTNYQIQKYAQFVTSVTKRVLLCGLLVFCSGVTGIKVYRKAKKYCKGKHL